jgi:hypothetical protein
MLKGTEILSASGKLGVLTPGMGAVATTFVAGVYAVQKGHGKPVGSLTQMGTIRLGKRPDKRVPFIKDFVPSSAVGIFLRMTCMRLPSRPVCLIEESWKR